MGQTLTEKDKENVKIAEIVHVGEKLIIPEQMKIREAIKLLERREKYLTETVEMSEVFDVFPWDGAVGLDVVLTKQYGWAPAEAIPSFWGPQPPSLIDVEIGYQRNKKVAWGRFSLPNVNGYVQTAVEMKKGRACFQLYAQVTRADEATVEQLFKNLREYLRLNSIYRGQAVKIRFRDDKGNVLKMPEPSFMNVSDINEEQLIYSDTVMTAVRTNLFTPITRIKDCLANHISVKRGVLLGGTFGTGKTLAAKLASRYAVESGITYIYVPRADELDLALKFAMQYQSPASVLFCEDIDRALSGDRSVQMDDILNIIDGVDSKNANIITVLTTNDLTAINPAMLRPGRLDAVIEITPPDAAAVERLIRYYGGTAIEPNTDLTEAGKHLDGRIPAVIAEVVKRAKLSQLSLQAPGTKITKLSSAALVEAARTMAKQLDLLYPKKADASGPTLETLIADAVRQGFNGTIEAVHKTHELAKEIRAEV